MKPNKLTIIGALLAIFILGVFILPSKDILAMKVNRALADSTTNVTYTCSMHPEVKSDSPGQCLKCGMDLILKENDQKSSVKEKRQKENENKTNHNNSDHGSMGMGTEMGLIMGATMAVMMIVLMSGDHR